MRHQARLIDDLLDVTRIATGKLVLRREPQNVSAAIQYAVDDCMPAITAKGQTLHVELPEEPLPVDADPVRLGQVFTNLLVNAHKYTDIGGSLRLLAAQEGSEVIVRVQDTGIGISPDMLPRVFDLFTQAAGAGGPGQSGLGIGLALVKHLVELHGGTVQAHSDGPGRGAEFVVRLPFARSQAPATSPGLGATALQPRRRVAVVEDNPDARATLAELLELLGYQVFTAADGAEALRLAHLQSVEAFVVDIGLPDIDGCEVARALRRMPGGDSRLLIALTGYGSPDELEQMRAAGFDAHLIKPAEVVELERLLAM